MSTVDDLMRFPKFDCNKLLVLPYEALTQYPEAFLAPIAQVCCFLKNGGGHLLLASHASAGGRVVLNNGGRLVLCV